MSWENQEKPGTATGYGWDYNETGIAYNQDIDTDTSLDIYYNGLGLSSTWSKQTKS